MAHSLALIPFSSSDAWVMATAVVCAVACAIPGCFLVLRRLSMLGDAISHAVLPGLAMAFLITGTRDLWPMLIGAAAFGLLTAVVSSWLSRHARVPEDASMGVVFSSLFALGVLLITLGARSVDLDPGCVLYGLLEAAAIDTTTVFGFVLPRALVALSIVLVLNIALTVVFWKEIKLVCFDPALATAMGISAGLVHYGLMGAVATTTVASFESVGSILVVAMLVAPGATAHLLTDRLARMVPLAALLAASCAVIGHVLALYFDTNIAGMMSVVAGVQFAIAALLAPRYGIVPTALRRLSLSLKIEREDLLGDLFRASEASRLGTIQARERPALPPHWRSRLAHRQLRLRGLITVSASGPALTEAGAAEAARIIRSHRLWEAFLCERLNLATDHVHDPSERMEHHITPEMERSLRMEFARTQQDPQGKPIP